MRRVKLAVFIHLVWATWDRLPLLTPAVERKVYRATGAKCRELGAEVIALGGVEDHVHLLVRMPATITIAELVGQVKGAASHLATHDSSNDGAFFKWQGAYAAFSVSVGQLPRVTEYIKRQKEHHPRGTLIQALELEPDHPRVVHEP